MRRVISTLLVLAGIGLLAFAGYHYWLGEQAQSAARSAWEEARASTPAPALEVPTPPAEETPATAEASPAPEEAPTPAGPSPAPAAATPAARTYPHGQPIARIRIASAQIDYVVFGGDDQETLEKGPGHVPGTELPGEDTGRNNCVITAHRDMHFRRLGWLRAGHRIELETPSGTRYYRVVSREIVDPDAVRVLDPTPKPRLTLITCYPFNYIGAAPHRLVIVAEPIGSPVQKASR